MVLYLLPISLFGMSVAASELPELSRLTADQRDAFLARVDRSMRQVLYLVVPTVVGYLVYGHLIVRALFGGGAFDGDDVVLVTAILSGYTIGLGATAASRLLQNSFYAIGRTDVPARLAVVRVVVSGVVGAAAMFALDGTPVSDVIPLPAPSGLTLAAVGLAIGASVGAWFELIGLDRSLRRHLPGFRLPVGRGLQMLGLAAAACVPGLALQWLVAHQLPALVAGVAVVGGYAAVYLVLGHLLGFTEGAVWTDRFARRFRRRA
jgi:putative peptidoglycan lipid II flippase